MREVSFVLLLFFVFMDRIVLITLKSYIKKKKKVKDCFEIESLSLYL